uniref:Uncharacterized protein n=1 Tax=Astyanax mexicanus TaxID=7994 RepID=A0A3B1JXY0_ASTMX
MKNKYLQNNNDPKHTSKSTQKCASQSPDLNPLEKLKIRVHRRRPRTQDFSVLSHLVKSYRRRLNAVLLANRGFIKYHT